MTLTHEKIERIQSQSHKRYIEALEFPNVREAVIRAVELQPLQSDRSLLNEENRIEYCALTSLLHAVVHNNKRNLAMNALNIWINMRQIALTSITFDNGGYVTVAESEHERTLLGIMAAHAEEQARDRDAKTFALAVALMNRGEIEKRATITQHNAYRQKQIDREAPIDVEAIVASVIGGSE